MCTLVKSTIFIVGNSNFETVYFKRYIFILCGKNLRFMGTLRTDYLCNYNNLFEKCPKNTFVFIFNLLQCLTFLKQKLTCSSSICKMYESRKYIIYPSYQIYQGEGGSKPKMLMGRYESKLEIAKGINL